MNTRFEQLVGSSVALESSTGLTFPRVSQISSISLWIYLKSGSNGSPRVIISRGKPGDDNTTPFPSLFLGSFCNSLFAHSTTEKDYISQWKNSKPKREIQENRWTHVAAVANHNACVNIYVDGELVSSEARHELPRNARLPVHIGKSESFQVGMCGLVRDVRVYTLAFSKEQIQQIANSSKPPDLFSLVVSDTPRNGDVSPAPRAHLAAPVFVEECKPFRSLAAGILDWTPGNDPLNVASVPLPPNFAPNKTRVIHCHDMKGGYLEDRFPQGANALGYNFHYWKYVDIFIYFAHHRVSIPPVGWINAAHKHSVQVLGTFIVEWEGGLPDTLLLLENIPFFVEKFVQIAEYYGFDGWFINIETELPSSEHANAMCEFLRLLTTKTHERIANSLVLWYDSVTKEGKLRWQNKLNDQNKMYFDVCDGIFLNYKWDEEFLKTSAALAGDRKESVFVGIDIFGRGTFGGGGFSTHIALELIQKYGLSTALFAPGWTYEVLGIDEKYENNERRYWTGVTFPTLFDSGVSGVPNNMEESGWKAVTNGGNGWKIEHTDNTRLFITSHDWCVRAQEINLIEKGPFVDCPNLLDYFPVINIEANFVGGGPKFPDLYQLRVELRDENHQPIEIYDSGMVAATEKWQKLKFSFTKPHEGKKLRYIYWEDRGRDCENWAGYFGTKIGPCSVRICSTLPTNQSRTSVASFLPNNKVKVEAPFTTCFNVGQGHTFGNGDWYNLSFQDIQPSFHNTNEIGSCISGSPLMEGKVEENEDGISVFSICGRLHLDPKNDMHYFLFSLFHFHTLPIPPSSSFSFTFSPQTDLSSLSLLLILEDSPPLLLSPSSPDPSFSPFHLSERLLPQKKQEKDKWQEMEFDLHEFRGKKIKEVQVLCYPPPPPPPPPRTSSSPSSSTSISPSSSSPSPSPSPPSPYFTYHLHLGGIGMNTLSPSSSTSSSLLTSSPLPSSPLPSTPPLSSPTLSLSPPLPSFSPLPSLPLSPSLSSPLSVYPFWSTSNLSIPSDSEIFDFFVLWQNSSVSKNAKISKTEICVDGKIVGSTLQNCYFVKNVKMEPQKMVQIRVKNESIQYVKYIWEKE